MVNQQKGVQQDTAYCAVVVNDHMYPYIVFDPKGIHIIMIIHYNCTIGSILLPYGGREVPYPNSHSNFLFPFSSFHFPANSHCNLLRAPLRVSVWRHHPQVSIARGLASDTNP